MATTSRTYRTKRPEERTMKTRKKTRQVRPVSPALAAIIQQLDARLLAEFGTDFGYTIIGGGGLVAASNAAEPPVVKPDPAEGRVYTVAELRLLPLGTVIEHPTLGKGVVCEQVDGIHTRNVVKLKCNTYAFECDGPPWDSAIRVAAPKA
jgi:hypothetical protein